MNENITFCRLMLRLTMERVTPVTTALERKAAWVYHFERDNWEFHGPDGFYWHGSADNAYDARANGWDAWLSKIERDGDEARAKVAGKLKRAAE